MVVWPVYAGAVDAGGIEPMFDRDYERGQIFWGLNEQGRMVGRAKIIIPRGSRDWTHIIYCHNAFKPGYTWAQKLFHPMRLPDGGTIDLIDITDEDFGLMSPDKVLH